MARRVDPPLVPGYYVYDSAKLRVYLPRAWPTEEIARRELAVLLRPYPLGHAWRKRLTIVACVRPPILSRLTA